MLEDFHRSDESSLQLLEHVTEWTTSAPLCLLVTQRDRVADQSPAVARTLTRLARVPGSRRLQLEAFGRTGVAEMLGDDVSEDVVDRVLTGRRGNPLRR